MFMFKEEPLLKLERFHCHRQHSHIALIAIKVLRELAQLVPRRRHASLLAHVQAHMLV
jgi:hypothetical protein